MACLHALSTSPLAAAHEALRMVIVSGCALALIAAGQALPFDTPFDTPFETGAISSLVNGI